jgi:hypothetical protein
MRFENASSAFCKLDAGADVKAGGGDYSNALRTASASGHEKAVQVLLDAGAHVRVQGDIPGRISEAGLMQV